MSATKIRPDGVHFIQINKEKHFATIKSPNLVVDFRTNAQKEEFEAGCVYLRVGLEFDPKWANWEESD